MAVFAPLPRVLVPHPHVRVDDAILSGSPHVVGSKVPVRRLWAWHRSGITVETLMRRYPNLGPGKILDALAFAYDNVAVIAADLDREQAVIEGQQAASARAPTNQLALPFSAGGEPAPARRRSSPRPRG
jgi:uncharacterized protein (DUF433 family)